MMTPSSAYLPFYILFLLFGAIERVISTFSYKKNVSIKKISDKWFFVPFYGYLALIACSILEFFIRIRTVNLTLSIWGLIFYLLGVFLRRGSISALGNDWSVYSEIKEGQILRTSGVYKFLKHPYYLAVFLELLGACLIANALFTLSMLFFIQSPILVMRIYFEEKMLTQHFGNKYEVYKKGKLI